MIANIFTNMPWFIGIPVLVGFFYLVCCMKAKANRKRLEHSKKKPQGFFGEISEGFWGTFMGGGESSQPQQRQQPPAPPKSNFDDIDKDIWNDKAG